MLRLFEIDWAQTLWHMVHIGIAYALALPIGWNREKEERTAGLRTFPLVAVASCGFMLIGIHVTSSGDAAARVLYGVATGIGFIGGGAILKHGGTIAGTATAASIWNTGAIGVAVAWSRLEIAVALSLINFLVLYFGQPMKRQLGVEDDSD